MNIGLWQRDRNALTDWRNEWIKENRRSEQLEKALSAYRASGLTPDELPHAAELLKAEKEGRCVLVPCKKGDVLWSFFNYPARAVCSMRVLSVSTVDGKTVIRAEKYGTFPASDIGKTVFLTRAEAEAAMGGGGDGE